MGWSHTLPPREKKYCSIVHVQKCNVHGNLSGSVMMWILKELSNAGRMFHKCHKGKVGAFSCTNLPKFSFLSPIFFLSIPWGTAVCHSPIKILCRQHWRKGSAQWSHPNEESAKMWLVHKLCKYYARLVQDNISIDKTFQRPFNAVLLITIIIITIYCNYYGIPVTVLFWLVPCCLSAPGGAPTWYAREILSLNCPTIVEKALRRYVVPLTLCTNIASRLLGDSGLLQ